MAYVGGGLIASNGAFNVVNAQKLGYGSILAKGAGMVMTVGVSGDVVGSALGIDSNAISITALGNDVVNALSLAAPSIATVAGVNNLQASRAGIDALLGTAAEPYKIAITADGDVAGSTLFVLDNNAGVMTVGNQCECASQDCAPYEYLKSPSISGSMPSTADA